MKILIVDDEMVELFISKKILSTEYEVEGFTTTQEALQWASQNKFDFLISDYYLDKSKTASEFLSEIKKIVNYPFDGFVLTNYIDDDKKADLIKAGYKEVINKPLVLHNFKNAAGL